MGKGSSPTDGRDLDGGPEEALFFPFALFLDLVSRGGDRKSNDRRSCSSKDLLIPG